VVVLTTTPTSTVVRKLTKEIDFCAGHRLLNYSGKCKNLHGHNLKAHVTFGSNTLDRHGMVLDFGIVKDEIKTWVDTHLDHGFIVNHRDTLLKEFLLAQGQKHFVLSPESLGLTVSVEELSARVELTNPTMENMVLLLRHQAEEVARKYSTATHPIWVDSVRLYESDTGWCDA
jgi:6-pyruvoyltetrahydropterin/6-carboxytetrahydropterin synthase